MRRKPMKRIKPAMWSARLLGVLFALSLFWLAAPLEEALAAATPPPYTM